MNIDTTYNNRTIDLELLHTTITAPTATEVTLTILKQPRIVTGIQKLIQKYCLIFLSIKDSEFDKELGTDFLQYTLSGALRTQEQVATAFAFANADTINILTADVDTDTPDDEIIDKVILTGYDINFKKSMLSLELLLITKAGDSINFILPTAAPRV